MGDSRIVEKAHLAYLGIQGKFVGKVDALGKGL